MDVKLKKDYIATIGVDVTTVKIPVKGPNDKKKEEVTLSVWDLAGQDQFLNIRKQFYLGANAAILIFDVTNRESFDHLSKWMNEVEASSIHQIPFFLVGNKIDLSNRVVSTNEMTKFSKNINQIVMTHETSALTGEGIKKLFNSCANLVYNNLTKSSINEKKASKKPTKKSSKVAAKSKFKKTTKKEKVSSKKSTKKPDKTSPKKATKKTSKKSTSASKKRTTKKKTTKRK